MDHAPSSSPIPPADQDFDQTFQGNPDQYSRDSQDEENASAIEPENEQDEFDPGINRNTKSELRRLQRIMMRVAEYDEMGSARASAARAWRDLEVLRCAKMGKPLMLNVTGKADMPRRPKPVALAIVPQDKAA